MMIRTVSSLDGRPAETDNDPCDDISRDQVIVDSVRLALFAAGYSSLRRLQVYCDRGKVIIRGRLESYFLKQVSQTLVLSVNGVHTIDNDVFVTSGR
jgi:osmotically-inducible protein OsmY